ncbi:hypothetical protein [Deinococcus sonorensis]|uniref:Uncharacterized protein n=2 Tax=Deinococcus sonorensis TaxID=309891 RepID=A0AAU7U6E2_9DEIO
MAANEVPYRLEEGSALQVADVQGWPWQLDGQDWVKAGHCPRCGHPVSKRLVMTTYPVRPDMTEERWHGPLAWRAPQHPSAPRGTMLVFCDCTVPHADGKSGCGFFVRGIAGPGGA